MRALQSAMVLMLLTAPAAANDAMKDYESCTYGRAVAKMIADPAADLRAVATEVTEACKTETSRMINAALVGQRRPSQWVRIHFDAIETLTKTLTEIAPVLAKRHGPGS